MKGECSCGRRKGVDLAKSVGFVWTELLELVGRSVSGNCARNPRSGASSKCLYNSTRSYTKTRKSLQICRNYIAAKHAIVYT